MTAPTIEDARATGRINGAMATVLRRQLDDAALIERATYPLAQEPLDGGHRQRVLVATDLGLLDWCYEWPRHRAWSASASLRLWADLAPVLCLRAQQHDERGSATVAANEWELRCGNEDAMSPVTFDETERFLAFAHVCLALGGAPGTTAAREAPSP